MASTYIENAIRTRLLADTDITDICSTRIYYLEAPENPTYPYMVIHEISDADQNYKVGVDGSNPRIQIDSIDKNETMTDVKALDLAVRTSLNDLTGTVDSMNINFIERGGSSVFREPQNILRITRDFIVNYDRV